MESYKNIKSDELIFDEGSATWDCDISNCTIRSLMQEIAEDFKSIGKIYDDKELVKPCLRRIKARLSWIERLLYEKTSDELNKNETPDDYARDIDSILWDIRKLIASKKDTIDYTVKNGMLKYNTAFVRLYPAEVRFLHLSNDDWDRLKLLGIPHLG